MKKWSEIKQAILDKLFMTEEEAQSQEYLAKFGNLANECLTFIANGVKPKMKPFSCKVYAKFVAGNNFSYSDGVIICDEYPEGLIPDITFLYCDIANDTHYVFKNNTLVAVENCYGKNEIISMPDDFLGFSDVVNYCDGEEYPDIIYHTYSTIQLPKEGNYVIYYDAMYEDITPETMNNDLVIDVEPTVLRCVPSYVASQLLAEDDRQRSIILKNEYELLLSRIDTDIMYQPKHFKSIGGWF